MDANLRYTRLQIRLHWAVAVLIGVQIAFCGAIKRAFDAGIEAGRLALTGGVVLHFTIGATILVLVYLRLVLRKERAACPPVTGAARLTCTAIYAVLVWIPISGVMTWGMASSRAAALHQTLMKVLLALVLAHICIAGYGQFVRKNDALSMTKPPGDDPR